MYTLLIDDCREMQADIFARNAQAAKDVLEAFKGRIDMAIWDHDLDSFDETGREITGYDVMVWAIDRDVMPDSVFLVTSNPVGRDRMGAALEDAGFRSVRGSRVEFTRSA